MFSIRLVLLCLGLLFACASAKAQEACTPYPFEAPVRSTPEAALDATHLHLDIDLDAEESVVRGRATYDVMLGEAVDSIRLATPHTRVDSVFGGVTGTPAQPLRFRRAGPDSVIIGLATLTEAGIEVVDQLRLAVVFEAEGIRFDDGAAWSLETIEPWFPWFGRLSDRFTSEMMLTVPSGWMVSGPGVQTATRTAADDRRTYLFSSPHELPPHRLGFLAGDFQTHVYFAALDGGRRVPVTSLGDSPIPETSGILESVSRWLDFAYPFERFASLAQVSVAPSAASGMVVVPAAAAAELTGLLDRSAALTDVIARQWIGTVLSAVDWSHIWFEEGLMSYLGAVATDAELRPYLASRKQAYLDEADKDVRPLVWQRWHHPAELYDAHAGAKGAWVAHMLHRRIGAEAFRQAAAGIMESLQFESVATEDLVRSFAAAGDTDLTRFADQWIYAAGHPILNVAYEPVEEGLYVRIEQLQQGELVPTAFDLDLVLEIGALGDVERFNVSVDGRTEEVVLPFSDRPRFVAVDPDRDWLLESSVEQPPSAWLAQLRYGSAPESRSEAAQALSAVEPEPALMLGLRSAFESEGDPTVRAQIIESLANVGTEAAERVIMAALADSSALVRRAVIEVLPELQDRAGAIAAASRAAQNDPSHLVQAGAVEVLAELDAEDAVGIARSALITPSTDGVIRAAGLYALSLLHRQAPRAALDAAGIYSGEEQTLRVRRAAIDLLGTLAPVNRQAAARLRDLLASPSYPIRSAAAEQLASIGSVDVLRQHLASEQSGRFAAFLASLIPCK